MKAEIIDYIVSRTPVSFLTKAVEHLEQAYFEAHSHSSTFDDPERPRVLGQLRHYRQNDAIRKAATEAGLNAVAPHTDPKGERYSLVAAGDIRFGRIGIPFANRNPRPSRHRKTIAAINSRLEPVNLSLFDSPADAPPEGLGCLVVTINPPRHEVQTVPHDIFIGVPYTNLREWHLFVPISEVIAAYRPATEIAVPDLAWVRLKKRMNDSEG